MSVQGFYRGGNGTPNINLDALVTAVAGIFGGTAGGSATEQATYDLFDNNITSLNNADTEFFDGNEDVAAYLNYIIFDKDFVESRSGFIPMDGDAYEIPMLMSNSIVSPVEGFIYVYLTNESNAEAYFDDFEVTVKESAIVQNTDYYPFGLSHNTSWTRPTDLKNNYLYNAGSELNEMTKNYETFYRNYDPALGRFNGVDIMATAYHSASPYSFANNDPVYFNDPMGDMPQAFRDDMRDFAESGRDMVNARFASGGSGRIGHGCGHWSDQFRSDLGNWMLMSTSDFNSHNAGRLDQAIANVARSLGTTFSGNGVYDNFSGMLDNVIAGGEASFRSGSSYVWNKWAGSEVSSGNYSGDWLDARSFEGMTFLALHGAQNGGFGGPIDFSTASFSEIVNQIRAASLWAKEHKKPLYFEDVFFPNTNSNDISERFLGLTTQNRSFDLGVLVKVSYQLRFEKDGPDWVYSCGDAENRFSGTSVVPMENFIRVTLNSAGTGANLINFDLYYPIFSNTNNKVRIGLNNSAHRLRKYLHGL